MCAMNVWCVVVGVCGVYAWCGCLVCVCMMCVWCVWCVYVCGVCIHGVLCVYGVCMVCVWCVAVSTCVCCGCVGQGRRMHVDICVGLVFSYVHVWECPVHTRVETCMCVSVLMSTWVQTL